MWLQLVHLTINNVEARIIIKNVEHFDSFVIVVASYFEDAIF